MHLIAACVLLVRQHQPLLCGLLHISAWLPATQIAMETVSCAVYQGVLSTGLPVDGMLKTTELSVHLIIALYSRVSTMYFAKSQMLTWQADMLTPAQWCRVHTLAPTNVQVCEWSYLDCFLAIHA